MPGVERTMVLEGWTVVELGRTGRDEMMAEFLARRLSGGAYHEMIRCWAAQQIEGGFVIMGWKDTSNYERDLSTYEVGFEHHREAMHFKLRYG